MAALTGQTISSTYDGLLKTDDNDILSATPKEITDGLGNGSGMTLTDTGDVGIAGDLSVVGTVDTRDVATDGAKLDGIAAGAQVNAVDSVNSQTGAVVLDSDNIAEGATNKYLLADSVTYAKLGAEFTTSAALATNLDFATAQVFTKTLTADTTLTFSNTQIGMVKDLVITGAFVLTLPAGSTVAGTYNGAVLNLIQIVIRSRSILVLNITTTII